MVAFGEYSADGTASTVKARDYKDATDLIVTHGTQDPCTADNLAFTLGTNGGAENAVYPIHDKTTRHAGKTGVGSGNGLGVGADGDKHAVCYPVTCNTKQQSMVCEKDLASTMGASDYKEPQVVAFAQNSRNELRLEGGDRNITGCLSASSSAKPGQGYPTVAEPLTNLVRRLTPVECERLQGFPDNHTRIPYRNKPADQCPDGPRYKAIGNSKAVPCVRWIGQRLQQHLEEIKTYDD
jgi:DNA (cytosine-5)-methyltransferase 1